MKLIIKREYSMKEGTKVLWKGPDHDFPGIFKEAYPKHTDGKVYARIENHLGTDSVVPMDQLWVEDNDL